MQPLVVACPTCKRKVKWEAENRFKPFCSDRCRNADMGAWATEQYAIATAADTGLGEVDSGKA